MQSHEIHQNDMNSVDSTCMNVSRMVIPLGFGKGCGFTISQRDRI